MQNNSKKTSLRKNNLRKNSLKNKKKYNKLKGGSYKGQTDDEKLMKSSIIKKQIAVFLLNKAIKIYNKAKNSVPTIDMSSFTNNLNKFKSDFDKNKEDDNIQVATIDMVSKLIHQMEIMSELKPIIEAIEKEDDIEKEVDE